MWCVAICRDVEGGAAARSALFQAHAQHNIARMGAFLLTGPIASADGATGVGDDPRLAGSLYCIDVETLTAARALMESDPFTNGVRSRIDYYEWDSPVGAWLDESARPKGLSADYRCYVAASTAPLPVDGALMTGSLRFLFSTRPMDAPFSSLVVLRALTMEEARSRATGAPWVMSLPLAIGRWVGISSPADLPKPQ